MEEPKKKRKLLIVDLEEPKFSGMKLHDEIIDEIKKLAWSKGSVNYGEDLWDVMNQIYKTNDEKLARELAEKARLMIAAARSAKQAAKLAKLGEYLQDKGVTEQDPALIEKGGKLVEKAKEMKEHSPFDRNAADTQVTKDEMNKLKKGEPLAPARPVQQKKAAKQPKKPVFSDPEQQKAVKLKYSWAKEGSFRQDPEKAGGTILDIECQKCKEPRTIHLADCFQVKLCLKCRGTK